MKLGALTLGAYRLVIVIYFSMKCPSLSNLINVNLKFTLSEISIATPACFLGPVVWYISSSLLP
jgi:hypothetical protein